MPCTPTTLPDGTRAIVCSTSRRKPCACGGPGIRLCDWKIGEGKTCNRPLCGSCTTSPAAGKDLCREHAKAFESWKANRPQRRDDVQRV